MHLGPARLAHGTVVRPFVAEVADQFFLLGVEWDHRLIVGLEGPDLGRDVLELGVATACWRPLLALRLAWRL
jgi:hypothetical protein